MHLRKTDKTTYQSTLMLWEGNRQIQEYTNDFVFTTVYDQDSFEPVSRLVQDRQDTSQIKVYHYHNNHLETPQELTDDCGNVVWCNYEFAWGGRYTHHYATQSLNDCAIIESDLQPISFQGQFYDVETGLHYNRFRYYDSDVGMFISRDPIGLLGGSNVFQYAPNPILFVDPLGLSPNSDLDKALGGKKYDRLSAHHLIPVEVWKEYKLFFQSIGMSNDRDKASNGLLIPGSQSAYKDGVGKGNKVYHSSNHNDYSNSVRQDLDNIINRNLSPNQARLEVKKLQMRLRREIWAGLRPMNKKNRLC